MFPTVKKYLELNFSTEESRRAFTGNLIINSAFNIHIHNIH